ncbi:hypothetical protein [Corynebacterium vitaeruminis]|uniref:TetR family transcriptional regulator n=1 Tax=Corynebacterium vitaeruminis DSM 20294 TaxID=1224164 RepID=W5XZW1_9CORY|nr:hypothetical protein [Corynebacterium vitaeruminis]AHI22190.1 TetR family transcriptional regulator [Corynebacterium vitaeruminis DSM 20294]
MRTGSDLTARARIRDVTVASFADEGFSASFRAIAARAGAFAGLATPHFGPEDALRTISTSSRRPTLELFTEGVLADRSLLDDHVSYLERRTHVHGDQD